MSSSGMSQQELVALRDALVRLSESVLTNT